MSDSRMRNENEINVKVSGDIHGAKVASEATFVMELADMKEPKSIREVCTGIKLSLYTITLRVFSLPAALLTGLESLLRGTFKIRYTSLLDHKIQVQVAEEHRACNRLMLKGQQEPKLLSDGQN